MYNHKKAVLCDCPALLHNCFVCSNECETKSVVAPAAMTSLIFASLFLQKAPSPTASTSSNINMSGRNSGHNVSFRAVSQNSRAESTSEHISALSYTRPEYGIRSPSRKSFLLLWKAQICAKVDTEVSGRVADPKDNAAASI